MRDPHLYFVPRGGMMKAPDVLKNRKFIRILAILCFTSFSEFLLESSIYAWIILHTAEGAERSLLIGFYIFTSTFPRIVGAAYFGVVSDRIGSSRAIWLSTLGRTLTVAAVVLLSTESEVLFQALILFACVFICSGLNQLLLAGRSKFIKEHIPAELYGDASRFSFTTLTGVSILSSALGPVAVEKYGLASVLWLILASFALSLVFSYGVKSREDTISTPKHRERAGYWKELAGAFRECWANPNLRPILTGSFIYGIPLGINNISLILLWVQAKDASVSQYGLATALFGAGAFVSPLLLGRLVRDEKKEVGNYVLSLSLLGLSYLLLGLVANLYVSYFLMFLCGLFFSVFATLQQPIMLRNSPESMVGRVTSVNGSIMSLTSFAFAMLASLTYSLLDSADSVYVLSVSLGGLITVIGGLVMVSGRRKRRPV